MNYYKKITVFYGAVIVFFFLLTTLTIVIPRLLEVTPYVVEDNKMAPKYSKGACCLFVLTGDRLKRETPLRITKIKVSQ